MKTVRIVSESRMFYIIFKVVNQKGFTLTEKYTMIECFDWLKENHFHSLGNDIFIRLPVYHVEIYE